MRTIERTTICVVLTIAPFVGIGCMLNRSGPPKLTRKEPKIYAVQRETPLSEQADTDKQSLPPKQLAKTETPKANPEIASDEKTPVTIAKTDGKTSSPNLGATAKKAENETAVAEASLEPKRELKKTSIPSTAGDVFSPKNVITAQSSTENRKQDWDDAKTITESSAIELVNHDESAVSQAEEIEFEIPKVVSPQFVNPETPEGPWDAPDDDEIEDSLESSASMKADQWTSQDGFDVRVEKIEERDFQQICLVKFREERVFKPGLPEFEVEYRAQRYRFSSAEAAEKFQADPEQFVPTAGGLDLVAFSDNQEVVQGLLDFAVWYKQRLFLFRDYESVATFQRQPEKFAAAK